MQRFVVNTMDLAGKYASGIYPDQRLNQQTTKNNKQYNQEIQRLLGVLQSNPPESLQVTQAMIALSELQNRGM